MNNKKPLILLSNDDGFRAKGIRELMAMIDDLADLLVVAPEGPRSGYSCAFSATEPLMLMWREAVGNAQVWSCSGTPADCIKLALDQLCDERWPAMVIAGINHGDNASVNTHYSGTMGVAMEGCMKYIPSVGFSLCDHRPDADFSPLRPYVRRMVMEVLENGLPEGVCLNVNFPLVDEFKGVRVCRMARGTWGNECVKCQHPRGYDYFWMTGSYTNDEPEATDTDNYALNQGYVTITPTQIDVTAYHVMDEMRNRFVP